MQATVISAAKTRSDAHAEPVMFYKRIGSTTYVVAVHFNQTGRETIEDKILRLIESEAKTIA